MPRVFVGNFDFEHELTDPARRLSPQLQRINQELAFTWLALAEPGEVIAIDAFPEPNFADHLRTDLALRGHSLPQWMPLAKCDLNTHHLEPWGWSDSLRKRALQANPARSVPPLEAVRLVNSRAFSFALEQEWKSALPGSARIESLNDLSTALAHLPSEFPGWVIKANFGMSARERILGQGRALAETVCRWVEKRVQRNEPVFLEPWVNSLGEAGIQIEIASGGQVELRGVTMMKTASDGGYRGTRWSLTEEEQQRWQPAVEVALRIAERAASVGYFGPLGIDIMCWRDATGNEHLRPVQDINARWTMGRLALGWNRVLHSGEVGTWSHFRWGNHSAISPQQWWESVLKKIPADVQLLRTSPFTLNGQPTRFGYAVIIGNTIEALTRAESLLHE